MASISSIKIIEGDFSLACLNKSLTRDAPTPTNISTKSEPDHEQKGTSASPATAFANNVLPVPGGPTKLAPFGLLAPHPAYFFQCLRTFTIVSPFSLPPTSPGPALKA